MTGGARYGGRGKGQGGDDAGRRGGDQRLKDQGYPQRKRTAGCHILGLELHELIDNTYLNKILFPQIIT